MTESSCFFHYIFDCYGNLVFTIVLKNKIRIYSVNQQDSLHDRLTELFFVILHIYLLQFIPKESDRLLSFSTAEFLKI